MIVEEYGKWTVIKYRGLKKPIRLIPDHIDCRKLDDCLEFWWFFDGLFVGSWYKFIYSKEALWITYDNISINDIEKLETCELKNPISIIDLLKFHSKL